MTDKEVEDLLDGPAEPKRQVMPTTYNQIPGKRGEAVAATCRCGHVGRSNYPDTYLCSVCYYRDRAKGELAKAEKLEARAQALRDEADEHLAASLAALKRRQEKGSNPATKA